MNLLGFENTEELINFCDDMTIAEEGKGDGEHDNTLACLIKIFGHMAKFKFHPENQSPSWVSSIIDAYNQLHDFSPSNKKKWSKDFDLMDEAYTESIKTVACEKSTGYKENQFPVSRPVSWTFNNVSNSSFILKFLFQNSNDKMMEKTEELVNKLMK